MKKKTAALAVGLCGVIGLSGLGLAACSDSDTTGAKSNYYLVGSFSDTTLPQDVDWTNQLCATIDEVPDAVSLKTTDTANTYTVTLNLYEGDEFQIVIVGQSWAGQMGAEVRDLDLDDDYIGDKPGGGTNSNFYVNTSGKYTLTFTVDGVAKTLSYTRDGDAPALPNPAKSVALYDEDDNEVDAAVIAYNGDVFNYKATITPADADDATVAWTTSDATVATVDNGKITVVADPASGEYKEVTITATSNAVSTISASVTIYVFAEGETATVKSITLNKEELQLYVNNDAVSNGTYTLKATVELDPQIDVVVGWSVKDEAEGITVDATGKVTALAEGTYTIVATVFGETAECEVTVGKQYYLTGNGTIDSLLKAGNFSANFSTAPKAVIFTPDEEEEDVYNLTVDLYQGDQFKVIFSGMDGNWTGQIDAGKLDSSIETGELGNSNGNIEVKKSGTYTLTLDMSGSTPVLSWTLDEEIVEEVVGLTDVEAWGNFNGWGSAMATGEVVADGTGYKAEVTLTITDAMITTADKDPNWQFRFSLKFDSGRTGATIYSTNLTFEKDIAEDLDGNVTLGSGNHTFTAAGTYKFTLTFDENYDLVSIAVVAA